MGWQMTVRPTRAPGHAAVLARDAAAAKHQLVMAAGGDGTLGDVANGLAGTDVVMAPLPVGTANSFARELRMPRPKLFEPHKLLEASDVLDDGRVQQIDLGFAHGRRGYGRYWLLWAGTGVDGFLVDRLEPRPKWSRRLGRIGYVMQCLMLAPRLPKMKARIDIDGQIFDDQFLLVLICNCRRYAGGELLLNPDAKLDDGLFEVWLFRGQGMLTALRFFLQAKRERHHRSPDVAMVKGRRVKVQTVPTVHCQTDGERAGSSPIVCELRPGMLRLLVPKTAPNDLFDRPGSDLV